MRVERPKWITREDVRKNRRKAFLFGDNYQERGYGGQAREMRGEPNSFGVPTKKAPSNLPDAFFYSDEWPDHKRALDARFDLLKMIISGTGCEAVVIPADGLGTGLSRLEETCPEALEYLEKMYNTIEKEW